MSIFLVVPLEGPATPPSPLGALLDLSHNQKQDICQLGDMCVTGPLEDSKKYALPAGLEVDHSRLLTNVVL